MTEISPQMHAALDRANDLADALMDSAGATTYRALSEGMAVHTGVPASEIHSTIIGNSKLFTSLVSMGYTPEQACNQVAATAMIFGWALYARQPQEVFSK